MRFNWWKVIEFFVVVLVFTFGIVFSASAVLFTPNRHAKEGIYLGITVLYNTIGGDFDGETMLTTSDEVFYIPKVESNYGWGVLLGIRSPRTEAEMSILQSTHDISFNDTEGEATYYILNFDLKPNFLIAYKPIQPYLLLGISFPILIVKDGSVTATDVGDADFSGIGLNIGGGIAWYFHPKVSISGGVIYRWIGYNKVEGVSGTKRDLKDRLGGSGTNFNVGITFTF